MTYQGTPKWRMKGLLNDVSMDRKILDNRLQPREASVRKASVRMDGIAPTVGIEPSALAPPDSEGSARDLRVPLARRDGRSPTEQTDPMHVANLRSGVRRHATGPAGHRPCKKV